MSLVADGAAVVALVYAATVPRAGNDDPLPARFALELRPDQDPAAVRTAVEQVLSSLRIHVSPLSALDQTVLVLDLLDRALASARPAACFAAGYALADRFDLVGAEPDLPTVFFPEQRPPPAVEVSGGALSGFPPGCWVDPEPALSPRPPGPSTGCRCPPPGSSPNRPVARAVARTSWSPNRTRESPRTWNWWASAFVPGFDVIDDDSDPTDPMTELGNPGHGTGTASVLVSLASHVRHRLRAQGPADADPRDRERGAGQAEPGRAGDRLGDREGARRHDEPWGHPRQRLTPRDQPSGRGQHDRPGRGWELRAPRCLARSLRRMHRCRCDERRRPAWPGTCRGTRGHLGAGQNVYHAVVPQVGPPAAMPSAKGRARASGRPDRRSRRTMGGSPRTSERGRRCTCARETSRRCSRGYCSPRPADPPRGTRRRWVPGSSMRVPFSRRASTWALARGCDTAIRRAGGRPNERGVPGGRGGRRRGRRRCAGLAPVRTGKRRCRSSATASWGDHRSKLRPSAASGPYSISNPRLRECCWGSDASGSRTSSRAGKPRSETRRAHPAPSSSRNRATSDVCGRRCRVVRPDPSGERGADRITLLPSRTDATTCRARSSRGMVSSCGVGSWR